MREELVGDTEEFYSNPPIQMQYSMHANGPWNNMSSESFVGKAGLYVRYRYPGDNWSDVYLCELKEVKMTNEQVSKQVIEKLDDVEKQLLETTELMMTEIREIRDDVRKVKNEISLLEERVYKLEERFISALSFYKWFFGGVAVASVVAVVLSLL